MKQDNKHTTETDHQNQAWDIFISEMIAHGNRRIAYQKAYPGSADYSSRTSAARLLKIPSVAQQIREGIIEMKKQAVATVRAQYQGQLADVEEKRKVLAQIIRGELVLEKEITKKGETQTIKHKSDPRDRIRAIMVDNQLEEEFKKLVDIPDNVL